MPVTIETTDDPQRLCAMSAALGYAKEDGYFERCLEEQAAGRRTVLVARGQDGQDAGYGMLNWTPRYRLYARLGWPEIQDLNVLHAMRRQGVAQAIIGHCEGLAQEKGCGGVGISVGLTAAYGPAQRLYVRLGFVPDGNGVTYDREALHHGTSVILDDDLCLMMVKDFA
jgi:GNAT superfamily N-acetyltransferase